MIFDSHCHTNFSPDSTEELDNYFKKAKEEGIGFIVTDHLDLNFKEIYPESYEELNPLEYREEYYPKRNKTFLLGIECGMVPEYSQKSLDFIDKIGPDFLLGSVHTVRGEDIYPREYFNNRTREEFWSEYFKYGKECVESHLFINSLSHIDYPARYNPYDPQGFTYEEFKEYLDPLFKVMIENDIALELNLRRFWNKIYHDELKSIFKGYKSLGGKMVTIGSDSHTFPTLGKEIKDAFKFIKDIGLTPVHFEEGKPLEETI